MSRRKILALCLSILTVLALLSACGGSPSSTAPAPSGGSAPAAAEPTAAPAAASPTEAPAQEAPDPQESDGEAPNQPMPVLPRPTEQPADSAAESGQLEPFQQSSGLFQIEVPHDWQAEEERSPEAIRNVFRSPDQRSFIAVYLNESSDFNDREQLAIDLETYLSQELGTTVQVKVGQADSAGRLNVELSYNLPDDMIGHKGGGYIANRGNLISFVIFSTPSDEFARWSNTLTSSADSFVLADNASLK